MYENYGWKYVFTAIIAVLWGAALVMNGVPLGLDLQGGDELIYQLKDPDQPGRNVTSRETEDTVQVLQDRIDVLGIKELSIRQLGLDKIVVQVPGATETQLKNIELQIERSGRLQFKILVTSEEMTQLDRDAKIKDVVEQKRLGLWKDTARFDVAFVDDDSLKNPKYSYQVAPGDFRALLYHCTPSGKQEFVEGALLSSAERAMDNSGLPCVGFNWGSQGRKLFYKMTSENIGKNLAVVLDNKLRSAPVIRGAIGKRGIIEMYDKNKDRKTNDSEINSLIVILKAGALPAKPVKAYGKKVGAQLGHKAVRLGSLSIIGALSVVILFMVFYYGLRAGLIADIALALNLFLILGTLSMFGATLTLPGIAGILLTAGMAVDANILIYERIREEIARGAALRQAVQAGYDRAFWTIFDANLTTALTAVVLMWVGTGPIKGFGLTLTIGIIVSMFTALFVTRALYGFFVAKEIVTEVKFKQLFDRPSIDFYGHNKRALQISGVFILVGWLVFIARGQEKYGIDFTGGTVVSMRLKSPKTAAEMDKRLAAHFKAKGQNVLFEIQRMGEELEGKKGQSLEWQIRTRRVEDAPATGKETETGSMLGALLPAAYGQDGGEPAPVESKQPTNPADPAPVDSSQPADPAPVGSQAAPPSDPALGPPAAPAPLAPTKTMKGNQDYFKLNVEEVFKADLVEPYPMINVAVAPKVDLRPYVFTRVTKGLHQIKFRVNMVQVNATKDDKLTAETIKAQLPKAFSTLAASLDKKHAQDRIALLKVLAGESGGPSFDVVALPDDDPDDGLLFEFTSHPLPAASKTLPDDVLGVFKEGLEKAQSSGATFAPAVPFPSVDTVGAAVAKNLSSKALMATFFCVILISLYVWLRFDFWSGIAAIAAVFHDVLALLGFLAILDWALSKTGLAFDVKFNLTTISAFLTLVGYSINDTIVILDRIREDKAAAKAKDYTPALVNLAINKTLARTVLTSLTSFLVCAVLFFASFGGLSSIQGLSVALLFGVAVGTYSSMFVAAPILLMDKKKVSLTIYVGFGFLVTTWLLSTGAVAPAVVLLALMVVTPFAFGKLGAFQVADPAVLAAKAKAKKKGKGKGK
jgi:SecD/SecF fusion protein